MKQVPYLISVFLLLATLNIKVQSVGIGTATPHVSALLDVSSTTQGFLPPRMTEAQRNAIVSTAAGLMKYSTNKGKYGERQVFNGNAWANMVGGSSSPPEVTICNQTWMLNNLDVDRYRNGDPIPKVTDPAAWAALTTGAYCYYNNDSATYAATYGKIYNWYAVNDPRGLAPAGWDIPSDVEWATLENCLGGASVAGGAMKETGTTHWLSPNTAATNSSGFTGLPGGYRNFNGTFTSVGEIGDWWSATEKSQTDAWDRYLYFNDGTISRSYGTKRYGVSVRCLKIKNVGIGITTPHPSALLDVSSTTKGFSPPLMTQAQRNAISSPVAGLMVWCSNCGPNGEMQVYLGTAWTNMVGNPATPPPLPTVITTAISGITSTSAVSGGNVTAEGGTVVTARGVCWDIATNPTVALSTKTADGAGTGSFVSNITGLTFGTTYYVRAYATNATGTNYGAQLSFIAVGIGDTYMGGKLAYILQPGDPGYIAGETHGLIAAASDQSSGTYWGCETIVLTGADGTALGTGNQNTIDIMAGCPIAWGGLGVAARICGDLVLNGYSDWYLPSKDELNKLYLNRVAIGGFGISEVYWSSSQVANFYAWTQQLSNGAQTYYGKGNNFFVRAVRSF